MRHVLWSFLLACAAPPVPLPEDAGSPREGCPGSRPFVPSEPRVLSPTRFDVPFTHVPINKVTLPDEYFAAGKTIALPDGYLVTNETAAADEFVKSIQLVDAGLFGFELARAPGADGGA